MATFTHDMELILEGLVSIASQGLQEINLQENFNVIQKLGDGSYGSVLMVQDKKTDQRMALKILNRKNTSEFSFLKEFSISFFLSSHPNIIGSFGIAFKTSDCFAFTQELSIGDLFSLIQPHEGLPEDTVKRCAVQISSALEFIDSKGLVHLDIKPENILVFDEDCNCIKITDFGFSHFKGTLIKTRSGTTSYMAPEMIQFTNNDALPVDFTLDVWAFGIVLHCLLTGEFPWHSAVFTDKAYSHFVKWQDNFESSEPPSPWRQYTPGALKMFRGLLALDCNRRSQATEVLMFLGECWKQQILESTEGTLEDTDTMEGNLSIETELWNSYQESEICEDVCARMIENVSSSSASITSVLSSLSSYLTFDTSESESEEPREYSKDNVLNTSIIMDDTISVHVGAEVEIG